MGQRGEVEMIQKSTVSKKYIRVILFVVLLSAAIVMTLRQVDLTCNSSVEIPATYMEAFNQGYEYLAKGETRGFLSLYLWQSDKTKRCYQLAADSFSLAVSIRPNDRGALTNRAGTYLALEQYDKAIDDYLRVLEINAGDFYARLGIAQAYEKSGQLEQAAVKYEEALEFMSHSQYSVDRNQPSKGI